MKTVLRGYAIPCHLNQAAIKQAAAMGIPRGTLIIRAIGAFVASMREVEGGNRENREVGLFAQDS